MTRPGLGESASSMSTDRRVVNRCRWTLVGLLANDTFHSGLIVYIAWGSMCVPLPPQPRCAMLTYRMQSLKLFAVAELDTRSSLTEPLRANVDPDLMLHLAFLWPLPVSIISVALSGVVVQAFLSHRYAHPSNQPSHNSF